MEPSGTTDGPEPTEPEPPPIDSSRLLAALPGEIQVLDSQGRLLYHRGPGSGSDTAAHALIGRSIAEWCRARGHPAELAASRQSAFEACLRERRPVTLEERRHGALGSERRSLRVYAPLADGSGDPSGAVSLAVDVPGASALRGATRSAATPASSDAGWRIALHECRERLAELASEHARALRALDREPWGLPLPEELPDLASVRAAIGGLPGTEPMVLVGGEPGTEVRWAARSVLLGAGVPADGVREVDCLAEPGRAADLVGRLADRPGGGWERQGPMTGYLFHEVCALSPAAQSALVEAVRSLEAAGTEHTPAARLVATTHRDLDREAARGSFRPDLRDRLGRARIEVPALRYRPGDLRILADRLIDGTASRLGLRIEPLTLDDVARLKSYLWPGNVPELVSVMERAVLTARDHLPRVVLPGAGRGGSPDPVPGSAPAAILTEAELRRRERANLAAALARTGWKIYGEDGAAALLGIPPTTLASRIKKMGIVRPE